MNQHVAIRDQTSVKTGEGLQTNNEPATGHEPKLNSDRTLGTDEDRKSFHKQTQGRRHGREVMALDS